MYNELSSPGRRLMNGIDTILEGNIQMDSEDHRILLIKVMSFKFIKSKRSLWLSR